jgi:hypothetical protein
MLRIFSFIYLFILIFFFYNSYKEIVVAENFGIENGMLELIRGAYLSIIEFLDSSILRKV